MIPVELVHLLKGGMENGIQIFSLVFKDKEGVEYCAPFECRYNYADAVEKSWRRVLSIELPKEGRESVTVNTKGE
jgi:hypothetical protein